jgi:hypothetical protein
MAEKRIDIEREKRFGDTAVDGLLAGVIGGAGMMGYLVVVALLTGQSAAQMVGRFDAAQNGSLMPGLLAHMGVSAVYGMMFALIAQPGRWIRPLPGPRWVQGVVYGLALFGVARALLLPAVGSPLLEIAPEQFAIAHALYGLLLGFRSGRVAQ